MKLVKKVAATLLGLTISFSFGACDLLGIGGKKDSNNSNGWENSSPEGSIVTGEGAKYMEGLVVAIREANTITLTTQFEVEFNNVDKTYGKEVYDEYYDEYYTDTWNDSTSGSANGNVTVTVAKAGETYSLEMSGEVSYSSVYYDYDDNYENQVQVTEAETIPLSIRIVGDTAYIVNPEDNQWYKQAIDWTEIQKSLAIYDTEIPGLLEEIYTTFMEGDLTEVYNILGPIFEQTLMLDIQNSKYNFELDIAEYFNTTIEYLTNLDYNQTILAYLNSVLVEAGAETTVEEMLREVATKGTMTVQELYNALNTALVEETGKDINGLKSEILAKIDLNEFKDYMNEETFAQISQMYTMISELNIETELAPYMSLTINDLVTMLMASQEEGAEPVEITLGMLTEQVISMMDSMTLADMLSEEYFEALEELQNLDLDELEENLSIQFNGYKISNVTYSADVDFAYDGAEESIVVDSSANVSINLSQNTTTITAPEGALDMPSEDEYV